MVWDLEFGARGVEFGVWVWSVGFDCLGFGYRVGGVCSRRQLIPTGDRSWVEDVGWIMDIACGCRSLWVYAGRSLWM